MATFDLSEFLEDDTVVLEGIRSEKYPDGKAYRFESPSAKVGLWLKNMVEFGFRAELGDTTPDTSEIGKLLLDDAEERDLYQRVMGATLDEMTEDGVSWGRIQKVFELLLLHHGAGHSIADRLARTGPGEAPARANRATRRSQPRKAGSRSNPASTGTRARTRARTSTRSSRTPEGGAEPDAQTA